LNKGFQAITAKSLLQEGILGRYPCLRAADRREVGRAGIRDPDPVRQDTYVVEMSKLGEMYVGLTCNAYKPVEEAAAKATRKVA
jgi:hypothetical protein